MSWPSDCWIGDENGENQIQLAGRYQPDPIPDVKRRAFGSERPTIGGTLVVQARGNDSGTLDVNLARIPRDVLDAIEALYLRPGKPPVQFFNSRKTYLCSWSTQPWEPERLPKRPERYRLQFTLRVLNEVEEE